MWRSWWWRAAFAARVGSCLVSATALIGCFAQEGYGNEITSGFVILPTTADTGSNPAAPGAPGATPTASPGADGTGGTGVPTGDAPSGMPGATPDAPDGVPTMDGQPTAGTDAPPPGDGMPPDGGQPPSFMCEGLEVACVDGKAGQYDCSGVSLLGHLDGPAMQGGTGNDIWGWTDPMTGKEYVLMGLTNGTAFVDISDPCRPVHLGHMRTQTVEAVWRDIKVYGNHAYIVSESLGHGMQVFDLTQLRNVTNPPINFQPDSVVDTFGPSHNLVLNEESGFLYAVMTNNCPSARSFDLSNPASPTDLGCWGTRNRIHDAQCVIYHGPDAAFSGREICFTGDEARGMGIYDVTDKGNVSQIGGLRYPGANYGHQGWLTEDHAYLLFGDEGDEIGSRINTTTYFFDVGNLREPTLHGSWTGSTTSVDHNLYVRGNYAFLAAYTAGLRILDLSEIASGTLTEVAYFDAFPLHDNTGYNAMWSNFPFFASGVVVTSGSEGLFILKPDPGFIE